MLLRYSDVFLESQSKERLMSFIGMAAFIKPRVAVLPNVKLPSN